MNPTTEEQLPPPPQPPQPHRNSTSCDRHPDEQFTGFCPSCLCERLAVLDNHSNCASTGRKSASSAIKSLFKVTNNESAARGRLSTSSFLPELRRTKSFSAGKNEGGFLGVCSGSFEPQRKSCDVRGRSTLFSLFNQDDVKRRSLVNGVGSSSSNFVVGSSSGGGGGRCGADSGVVIEFPEEGERVRVVEEVLEGEEEEFHDSNGNVDEIEEVHEEEEKGSEICGNGGAIGEIQEEERVVKTMKDHMDNDSTNKKGGGSKDFKELAGSFWTAASVFSKKLKAWRKKHNNPKLKKHNGAHTVQPSWRKGRNCRDTQSEIADYGFGRPSCDIDPRFSLDAGRFSVDVGPGRYSIDAGRMSLDAGRMSFDDPRGSFEEPRASWDGYLMGRTFPRLIPPMVSVVEDAPVVVSRKDMQIPVEEPRRSSVSTNNGDDCLPGGASQTKDYYSDSSSRRRKSLDRSSSIRKTAAAVVGEMDGMKDNGCSHFKVTNAHSDNLSVPIPVVFNERENRDFRESHSNSNSVKDDYSESFGMGCRDNASGNGDAERKRCKKSRNWKNWGGFWGLLIRRSNSKDVEDDRYNRGNGVERSFSESWQDLRREGFNDPRAAFSRNVLRSNSWRNSYNIGGPFGSSFRKGSSIEVNGNGKKKKDEFVLERNRSARYSPNKADNNGMLRFYLAPLKGSRKGMSGKTKPAYSHSFARSMLRLS